MSLHFLLSVLCKRPDDGLVNYSETCAYATGWEYKLCSTEILLFFSQLGEFLLCFDSYMHYAYNIMSRGAMIFESLNALFALLDLLWILPMLIEFKRIRRFNKNVLIWPT